MSTQTDSHGENDTPRLEYLVHKGSIEYKVARHIGARLEEPDEDALEIDDEQDEGPWVITQPETIKTICNIVVKEISKKPEEQRSDDQQEALINAMSHLTQMPTRKRTAMEAEQQAIISEETNREHSILQALAALYPYVEENDLDRLFQRIARNPPNSIENLNILANQAFFGSVAAVQDINDRFVSCMLD